MSGGAINGTNKTAATKMLVTQQQKENAKGRGDICGWFGLPPAKPPRGHPKRSPLCDREIDDDGHQAKKQSAVRSFIIGYLLLHPRNSEECLTNGGGILPCLLY
jgi:hypothetical protein